MQYYAVELISGLVDSVWDAKATQCLELQTTSPRGHRSIDSNLTSGSINKGRSIIFMLTTPITSNIGVIWTTKMQHLWTYSSRMIYKRITKR